jgi:hypothetical protein
MKLFLFKRIEQVSEYYHPEGGLVIVADNEDHARTMILDMQDIEPTEEEWAGKVVYELAGEHAPAVYVFPDAGCCG